MTTMPDRVEIRGLLDKLGRQLNCSNSEPHPFESRGANFNIAVYKSRGSWPGNDYMLAGNSFHNEMLLIDTNLESRRSGCFSLMLERHGRQNYCITVKEALAYDGFVEVISAQEHSWLSSLPEDTLLGPAYDADGTRVRSRLSVWKRCRAKTPPEPLPLQYQK
jgi:hypothetical protein